MRRFLATILSVVLAVGLVPAAPRPQALAAAGSLGAAEVSSGAVAVVLPDGAAFRAVVGQLGEQGAEFAVAKIANRNYTGKALKPSPAVKFAGKKLKKGSDYTLAYKNNKKVGAASVVVKGKGNFTGTKTVKFKIVKSR